MRLNMHNEGILKDRKYYNLQHKAPACYQDDPLDLYRFKLAKRLLSRLDKGKGLSVLNVASGYGREAYLILGRQPKFMALCDYSLQQLKYAEHYLNKFIRNYVSFCCEAENLPLKDKSFDVCYIAEALHHFPNPGKALEEFIRVTRRAVVIDEPAVGVIRNALNWVFVRLGLKEELERGYLETTRISLNAIMELSLRYKFQFLYFPYFIYYFKYYKRTKRYFIKYIFASFFFLLNAFFHFFGNRAIVILLVTNKNACR